MDKAFLSGLEYGARQLGTASSLLSADAYFSGAQAEYYGEIEAQIDDLISALLSRATNLDGSIDNKGIPSLAGNLFEEFAAGSWKARAAAARKAPDAAVLRSQAYASPDVVAEGVPYSAKVYESAAKSFREQAKTPYQDFSERLRSFMKKHPDGEFISEETFYRDRGILPEDAHYSMYHGQKMLVPRDQLKEAIKLAKQNAERNRANGDLQEAARYQEIADNLTDRIRENGVESIPLTREEILEVARLVKKALEAGDQNAAELRNKLRELGLDAEKLADLGLLFTPEEILAQVLRDGMKAGAIALVLTVAPVILEGILQLMRSGELDRDAFSSLGGKAAEGAGFGFITGALTSGIVLCGKTGRLGEGVMRFLAQENSTSVIAAGVVLCISTIRSCVDRAGGKLSKAQFVDELVRNAVITVGATVGGVLFSAAVPFLHGVFYMLGSFIGSVLSGFLYHTGKNLLLSFCVDSGWTFFGLVEQDYRMPVEALTEMGMDIPDLDHCETDTCETDKCELESYDLDRRKLDSCEIRVLRRGFIEVSRVAYC